jgi:hypothetical protein
MVLLHSTDFTVEAMLEQHTPHTGDATAPRVEDLALQQQPLAFL